MIRHCYYISLAATNLMVTTGVILFIVGFFRGRPSFPHSATFDVSNHTKDVSAAAPFDKIVFMMVDALRSDFVFAEGTGFEYTQSLIRSGMAIPYTARAASPTLTLSRVKALTQGTSQSFLDIWLNVFESESARSLLGADTWLSRLKSEVDRNQKMVFYGADLWLDVYPDVFDRSEGTNAWYLPEFTTVDSNVTRHLPHELEQHDWKALVLHYLGLDNIAHQGGPHGAHMLPKQAQMDSVVKFVHAALETKPHLNNTLFVMLGDHGMTEQGNHGGGSPGEISAAMVFVSPKLKTVSRGTTSPVSPTKNFEYHSVISQIDFVPTLAGLMGFTIPAKSLGVFVPEFLDLFERPEDRLRVLSENAHQMELLLRSEYDINTADTNSCTEQCSACSDALSEVVCWLGKFKTNKQRQNVLEPEAFEAFKNTTRNFCYSAQRLLNIPPNNPSQSRLAVSIAALGISMLLLLRMYSSSRASCSHEVWAFGLMLMFHAPTMFINELVVGEHHYWYWTSTLWLAYLGFQRMNTGNHWLKAIIYPVALQILSQSLDEATNPQLSIVNYIHDLFSGHQVLYWIPGLMIYVSALSSVTSYLGLGPVASMLASTVLCTVAILSRLSASLRLSPDSLDITPSWFKDFVSGISRNESLNIFWVGLGACLIAVVIQSRLSGRLSRKATVVGVVELANLYLRSLARPEHLVLFPIFDLQLQWLLSSDLQLGPSGIAVTSLLLGQSAFFASGHGNTFASFDLTNGFNGIETSRAVAVAIQALLSNYFGPVWWSLSSLRLLVAWSEGHNIAADSTADTGRSSTNVIPADTHTIDGKSHHTKGSISGVVDGGSEEKANGSHYTNGHTKVPPSAVQAVEPTTKTSGDLNGFSTNGVALAKKSTRDVSVTSDRQARSGFVEHLTLQTAFTATTTLVVVLACIWKRDDPSIWSVLTPKCLNIILWAVFQQLMINSILCTVVWLLAVM